MHRMVRHWAVVKEFGTYCTSTFPQGGVEQGGFDNPVLPPAQA